MKELPTPTLPLSPISLPRGSLHRPQPAEGRSAVQVAWARHLEEVRAAQRLRHEVFAVEMGARLQPVLPGHDIDLFDDYCEHLLVRDADTQQVIGTYRVLTPEQAKRVGGFYSDTEFDLTRLRSLRSRMVGWAAAACIATIATVASSLPCGERWPSSCIATSLTP